MKEEYSNREMWGAVNEHKKKSTLKKRNSKRKKFDELANEKGFLIISEHNNVIHFSFYGRKYYYTLKTDTFRLKGEKATMDFSSFAETDYDEEYMLTFGKYKGSTLKQILLSDKQYLVWLFNTPTINPNLHKLLDEMLKSQDKTYHLIYDIDITCAEEVIEFIRAKLPKDKDIRDLSQITLRVI